MARNVGCENDELEKYIKPTRQKRAYTVDFGLGARRGEEGGRRNGERRRRRRREEVSTDGEESTSIRKGV